MLVVVEEKKKKKKEDNIQGLKISWLYGHKRDGELIRVFHYFFQDVITQTLKEGNWKS